jgi:hypothetical protein
MTTVRQANNLERRKAVVGYFDKVPFSIEFVRDNLPGPTKALAFFGRNKTGPKTIIYAIKLLE